MQRVLKGDHQVIKGVGHSLGVSVVSTVTKEQNGTLPTTGNSKAQEAGAARYQKGSGQLVTGKLHEYCMYNWCMNLQSYIHIIIIYILYILYIFIYIYTHYYTLHTYHLVCKCSVPPTTTTNGMRPECEYSSQ